MNHIFKRLVVSTLVLCSLNTLAENMHEDTGGLVVTPKWYNSEWYRKPVLGGLAYYAKVKKYILSHNVYSSGENLKANPNCGSLNSKYRTFDGACNDFDFPMAGAAGTLFSRNMPSAYNERSNETEPNVRDLSVELFTRKKFIPSKHSNLLLASFLQFSIHDWINHTDQYDGFVEVPLKANDPIRMKYGISELYIPQTVTKSATGVAITAFANETSHWFDSSQLYGTRAAVARKLRTGLNGMLKMEGNYLPKDSSGVEVSGDNRNWWLGLSLMHTLFTLEHNDVARELKVNYPTWDDEKLYQTARLVVAAEIVKIFMTETTSARFENLTLQKIALFNWYGPINTLINFKKTDLQTSTNPAWEKILFGSPLLSGLMGGKKETGGIPFSMTEEWAQVYKYHSLVPDSFVVSANTNIDIVDTRADKAGILMQKYGVGNLLRAFGKNAAGAVVLNNSPKFLQNLEIPVVGRMDVIAVDLFRERERGLPFFNQFRRNMGLAPYKSFEEMTKNAEVANKLSQIYGGDIEKLDLTVGLHAEYKEDGFELGETTVQSLALFALRRIQGDRFYTTDFNANTYSKVGMNRINHATLKGILVKHFPELKNDLEKNANPFQIWK